MSKPKRQLIDNGNGTHSVPLTRGMVAIIDSSDAPSVGTLNWCAVRYSRTWYACSRRNRKHVYLHREVMGHPVDKDVDHRNLNGLDCRRENLRVASKSQNAHNAPAQRRNTSGFKGASLHRTGRWLSQIRVRGHTHYLGLHDTPELAHAAYGAAAERLCGEFARLG